MNKIKVLLADDSEKLIAALRDQLRSRGMEVTTCSDAYTALSQARTQIPDVMILDIRMPAGEGFSVLERMRQITTTRDIPIIFITGDSSEKLSLKAEQLGAFGLLRKPISLSAMLRMIDSAVERKLSA